MKAIEFLGMPNAGKGSLVKRLQEKLKEKGYPVQRIPDPGDSFNFLNREISLERLSWTFCYTLGKLLELQDYSKAEVLLVVRGVWDHLAFVRALQLSGKISKKEAESISRFFRLFANKEDQIILVMVPPEVSFDRGRVHPEEDISQYQNPVVNLEFLRALEKAYREIVISSKEVTPVLLDGTKTIEENLQVILEEITSLLPPREEKLPNDLASLIENQSGDCPFSEIPVMGKKMNPEKEELRSWVKCFKEVIVGIFAGRNGKQLKNVEKV